MQKYLLPLEQLDALNAELNAIAITLSAPIIIVGGQSVSYWYSFYKSNIPNFDLTPLASVDLDYIAQKVDIKQIANQWNVDFKMANIDVGPPSIAVAILKDKNTHEVKIFDGHYFLDVDKACNGELTPNIVDFIDAPAGFAINDIKLNHLRKYLAVPYEFSNRFNLQPNKNILILNPIGCLKSRLANIMHTPKPVDIELIRIKSLTYPLIYFFQDLHEGNEFRLVRRHINVLIHVLLSEDAIQVFLRHQIDFRMAFNFIVEKAQGNQAYHEWDAPILIGKLNDRYEKRLKSHLCFVNRHKTIN